MADEIDAGRIVAEIVLDTEQAKENAEEIKQNLDEITSKKVSPKVDSTVYEEIARLSQKAADEYRSRFSVAVEDIDKKVVTPTIEPKLDQHSQDSIKESYKELQEMMERNTVPTIKPQIDTSLIENSYDDTVEEICTILEKMGITGENANKIIGACFQDVSSLRKYQNQLQILADKLELARTHYQKLARAKAVAEKLGNVSEVDKMTTAMAKQAVAIKSLEAQYNNTYDKVNSAVKKAVTNYQKQADTAQKAKEKEAIATEKAMEKQVKFNQALARKQAVTDFAGAINLATTSLRTFDSMVPDTIDGIGQIITQINAAKQAMTMGVSKPLAWSTAIVAGIGIVTNLIVSAAEKRLEAEREAINSASERAEASKQERTELESLTESYMSVSSKISAGNATYSESIELKKQLADLQDRLVEKYGDEAKSIDLTNGNIEENIKLLREQSVVKAQTYTAENYSDYLDARSKLSSKKYYRIEDTGYYGTGTMQTEDGEKNISEAILDFTKKYIKKRNKAIQEEIDKGNKEISKIELNKENPNYLELIAPEGQAQDELEKYVAALKKYEAEHSELTDKLRGSYNEISKSIKNANTDEINSLKNTRNEYEKNQEIIDSNGANLFKNIEIDAYVAKISKYKSAMSDLSSVYKTVSEGGKLNSETLQELCDKYLGIADYVNKTGDLTLSNGKVVKRVYEDERNAIKETIKAEIKRLNQLWMNGEADKDNLENIRKLSAALEIYNSKVSNIEEIKPEDSSVVEWSDMAGDVKELASAYQTLNEGKSLDVDTTIALIEKYPEVASVMANAGKLGKEQANVFKTLFEAKKSDYILTQQVAIKNLEATKQETEGVIKSLMTQVQVYLLKGQIMQAVGLMAQIPNQSNILNNVNNDIEKAQARIRAIKSLSIDTYGTSGGGSGSDSNKALANELKRLEHKKAIGQLTSKQEYDWLVRINNKYRKNADEQMDMEKRLYNAKKQMREDEEAANTKALQAAYKGIENKKSLGKMTSQQELKQLEQIRQKYKMTAEERMELEIKIYNLKKSLKDDEISSLNTLADAVTEALKEKYEEQRKLEEDRINESIESWQEWEDKTVAAIQGEIDALDELADKQESENKRQEYENKRQQTELQLAYEKDDYNRTQLQKELNRLDKEEAERLAQEQREAKKKALQGQIEAVKGQSQATQERLKNQLDEVGEKYDKLTDSFSLKAQAQKFIANSTQQQIVNLIKSYASDYEIAGNTIGDALHNDMKSKLGDLEKYVDGIFGKIEAYQRQVANTANAAADKFWKEQSQAQTSKSVSQSTSAPKSVTVNQTVNFNQPIESPVEVRRQLDRTNKELAKQISSGI